MVDHINDKCNIAIQFALWGYAITGKLPRDKTVLRCEDRDGWVHLNYPLWDLTDNYFRSTTVNGQRPPWRHALLPAVIAAKGAVCEQFMLQ